jgi:hypothetical protein
MSSQWSMPLERQTSRRGEASSFHDLRQFIPQKVGIFKAPRASADSRSVVSQELS